MKENVLLKYINENKPPLLCCKDIETQKEILYKYNMARKYFQIYDDTKLVPYISDCDFWTAYTIKEKKLYSECAKIFLETGSYSRIMLYSGLLSSNLDNKINNFDKIEQIKEMKTGIYISIFNKRIRLPIGVNFSDVHKLVCLYEYALIGLKNTNGDSAKIKELKHDIENNLRYMMVYKTKTICFDYMKYIDLDTLKKIDQKARLSAVVHSLIAEKLLPPEKEDFRYTYSYDDLEKLSKTIKENYLIKEQQKKHNKEVYDCLNLNDLIQ